MQVTFIVRNLTETTLQDISVMDARAAHDKLTKWAFGDLRHCVSVKYGSFRDSVEWNRLYKSGAAMAFKMEPRKGYKLFTFTMGTAP